MKQPPLIVDVYIGKIPENVEMSALYPAQRWEEILSCQNEGVRRQKYCVWKLLEEGIKQSFGLDIRALSFEKLAVGKWQAEGVAFSLAHSGALVVAAVAAETIGVDVERQREKLLTMADKILTEGEKREYEALTATEKSSYLVRRWTMKESVYKAFGKHGFVPREIDGRERTWICREMEFDGDRYAFTVAAARETDVRFHLIKGYLEK